MSAERWRCFIAVPIGEALRASLHSSVESWRERSDLANLRWTDPDAWHLTLAFLGDVDPSTGEHLRAALAQAAVQHEPMRLTTGGLGAVPSPARARVCWYVVADADHRLARLADSVADVLELDRHDPYRPHITLARARHAPVDLREWLASALAPNGSISIDRVDLMRSHQGNGSARYESLYQVALGARVHA